MIGFQMPFMGVAPKGNVWATYSNNDVAVPSASSRPERSFNAGDFSLAVYDTSDILLKCLSWS